MKLTDRIFWKIRELSKKLKSDFVKKGIIIPTKTPNGSVRVGSYVIDKQNNDFYTVRTMDGETVVQNLNLPQTAIIVANTLALKKVLDKNIIDKDIEYGYAYFEHQLYKRAVERSKEDPTYYDVRISKFENSGEKADDFKAEILHQYEKLKKIA